MPTFHRKSHFKALTSVFLKQGQGSQMINTSRPEGDPEDNKFVEKLMLAINKTQAQAVAQGKVNFGFGDDSGRASISPSQLP